MRGRGRTVPSSDDDDNEIDNPTHDSEEVKEAEEDEGDELLKPHGLQWVEATHGVVVDEPTVSGHTSKLLWHDGLQTNERSPFHFFYHLYPREHLPATLAALN